MDAARWKAFPSKLGKFANSFLVALAVAVRAW